jgi:hypothetical protein
MSAMNALRASLLILLSTVVVGLGSPAFADGPETWPTGTVRTPMENLVFFGGAVGGLIVVITLFSLLISRNNFVPEPPEPSTDVEEHGHH